MATDRDQPRPGSPTKWGAVDTITTIAPGIIFASTPSHGGIWLSQEREQQIPEEIRAIAREFSPEQWYEEDCDAVIPTLWFASEIRQHAAKHHYGVDLGYGITCNNIRNARSQVKHDERFNHLIRKRLLNRSYRKWVSKPLAPELVAELNAIKAGKED
jgi:hypothetical protein